MSTSHERHQVMRDPVESSDAEGAEPRLLGVVELIGVPESVRQAREFVREVLGEGHPIRDEVMLLVSELVTNSVTHSDSKDGGPVTLAVSEGGDVVHVEVVDSGSEGEPQVRDDLYGEGGRGLFLVDSISEQWGMYRDGAERVIWFAVRFRRHEARHPLPSEGSD